MKNKIEKKVLKELGLMDYAIYTTQLVRKAIKLTQKLTVQAIFDDFEKSGKYKLDKKVYGQEMMVTLGNKRWNELKKRWGCK